MHVVRVGLIRVYKALVRLAGGHSPPASDSMSEGFSVPFQGFPGGSDGKASASNAGNLGSITGSGRSPGEENGKPLQYPCLEKSHRQRSLVGCSTWGHKETGMTEQLTLYTFIKILISVG